MKITHRKQKGDRYALVFETEEEAKKFAHYVGCRYHLRGCKMIEIKNGAFGLELAGIIFNDKPGAIRLPV